MRSFCFVFVIGLASCGGPPDIGNRLELEHQGLQAELK
jgi:hypothetical protein